MNFEVVLTCAVTGAGDTVGKSDKVPVSAKEIADDAINAMRFLSGDVTNAIESSLARVYGVDSEEISSLLFPEE